MKILSVIFVVALFVLASRLAGDLAKAERLPVHNRTPNGSQVVSTP